MPDPRLPGDRALASTSSIPSIPVHLLAPCRVPLMTIVTATDARRKLYRLLDDVAESHDAIQIAGPRHSAVLVSEEDWRAIQETLFLTSIPGMKASILKGLRTPVAKCHKEPGWWLC